MARFTYNDVVRVVRSAPKEMRPTERAWIVGVTEADQRRGRHYESFPPGPVYTIEFEDGTSTDIEESNLEPAEPGRSGRQ